MYHKKSFPFLSQQEHGDLTQRPNDNRLVQLVTAAELTKYDSESFRSQESSLLESTWKT